MQQAHADLLAGATFALNEDGNIGLCYPLQLVSDGLHGSSLSENDIQRWQVERHGGFGVIDQGHFFLSVSGRTASLQYASHSTLSTNS